MKNKKLLTIYETHNKRYALELMIDNNSKWRYNFYFYKEDELINQINLSESHIEKIFNFIKNDNIANGRKK